MRKTISMPPSEVTRIRQMLEYRRPARSVSEVDFITRYIDTIPGIIEDQHGNRILISPESRVMISCHTDSVHRSQGRQQLHISRAGVVSLARQEGVSNCLGADDCAGIYAALRMIEAGVKATFIFHRDEESGGNGSTWLARNYPDWIGRFDICLALDRRGTKDVIVSQQWRKCASKEFSAGLAEQLAMGHGAAEGIFTDSANYTDLIPECSNLSIGYENEHSSRETLDLNYLEDVIGRLIQVDWSAVPVARKPGDDGANMFDWRSKDLDLNTAWDDDDEFEVQCVTCGRWYKPSDAFMMELELELNLGGLDERDYCPECILSYSNDAGIEGEEVSIN